MANVRNMGSVATLGTKSITANGTYNASADNLDGFSQVSVNVPTGIPKITKAEWDQLTTAEKQALQYVAIQESSSGFYRGKLVYGEDFVPKGTYIPYTNEENVICEAYADIFDASSLTWGVGDNPVNFSANVTLDTSEDAVSIPVSTSGIMAYVDLLAPNTPFTAYIVMKALNPGSYSRLLSALVNRSYGSGILLYGSTITVSTWGDDTSLNTPSNDYFAGVLQFSGIGNAKGGIYNNIVSKAPTAGGRYVTLGRSDINPDTYNAEPCDIKVRYCAVTNSVDSDNVINNNLNNLINQFIN